ncbi:MAG: hypothetical protein JWM87_1623 [Candidatus Eremiobacteraeota bacterium]|nr:hypothetical protein [Candidatus Eremiobacteraeota bacterium]
MEDAPLKEKPRRKYRHRKKHASVRYAACDRADRAAIGGTTHVTSAVEILADGKARDAEDILREGLKRGVYTAGMTRDSLYNNLASYIEREIFQGRKPMIVQDERDRHFRINHPMDDWPDVSLPPRPRNCTSEELDTISARLHALSTGHDPAAFEQAVCDAFAMLGFITRHIGGMNAPDGTLDAPLGPLGYRAMLECKTAQSGVAHKPHPEEAAKFRELFGGSFAILIGPAFGQDATQLSELTMHAVSRWTVADLVTAIANDVDVFECKDLFAPGPVGDRLGELVWYRWHGNEKRRTVVRDTLQRAGYALQREMVGQETWADSPVVTLDVGTVIVEQALRQAGAANGPTRDEIRAAMDELVRCEAAVTVPGRDGIVIRSAGAPARSR